MQGSPSSASVRQHDMDALRAFAMLLGIGFHASLSFGIFPWVVQDRYTSPHFLWFFASVHGFRMSLFIFVSGYFTMMLWRRRGLKALLKQRFQRVMIPCLLGLVTVVPAMNWASGFAMATAARQDARQRQRAGMTSPLVEAVRENNLKEVEKLLAGGASPDQLDPEFGIPTLGWAAIYGEVPIAQALIDRGANVNIEDREGNRPLHQAAFLGQIEVLELLIQRGADPAGQSKRGDRATDSAKADMAATKMIAGIIRVPLRAEDELESGRAECIQILKRHLPNSNDNASGATGFPSLIRKGYAGFLTSDRFLVKLGPQAPPIHLILTPIFHHLWFLWFLCWLVPIFALVAVIVERLGIPGFPRQWILSPWRILWVIPLTMLPQLLMGSLAPGYGPDTSAGLIPQPHLLLYYGVFFGIGALYYDADDREGRLGRWWGITLPLALLVLLPIGLITSGQFLVSGPLQVGYTWAMTFGLIGLFRRLLTRENRTVRYLSDSAYWLYLVHLPLVILLQVWVREWKLPTTLKFLLVCNLATVLLLISYQTLVRYTAIGRMLNGSRKPPGANPHHTDVLADSAIFSPVGSVDGSQ